MTTIYRLLRLRDNSYTFIKTRTEAIKQFKRTERAGIPAILEALDVERGKDGLVAALNLAICHPANWPGTTVMRTPIGTT